MRLFWRMICWYEYFTKSKLKLLWIIGALAFILSAIIDNLTARPPKRLRQTSVSSLPGRAR